MDTADASDQLWDICMSPRRSCKVYKLNMRSRVIFRDHFLPFGRCLRAR